MQIHVSGAESVAHRSAPPAPGTGNRRGTEAPRLLRNGPTDLLLDRLAATLLVDLLVRQPQVQDLPVPRSLSSSARTPLQVTIRASSIPPLDNSFSTWQISGRFAIGIR